MENAERIFSDPQIRGAYPMCFSVFEVWNRARAGAFAPTWSAGFMMDIPPKTVPSCVVVEVVDGGRDFVVRFWGANSQRTMHQNLTRRSIREIRPQALATRIFDIFARIVASKEAEFHTELYREVLGFQGKMAFLRLPFSADGATVDRILSITEGLPAVLMAFTEEMKKHGGA